ncbi:MAG: ArnT family glycosyltransferase [Woeseiaceae bacterium]
MTEQLSRHATWLALITFIVIEAFLFNAHFLPTVSAETDGIGYMSRASGDLFRIHPFHGPGYSLFIRALGVIGLDAFNAAKLISILSGALLILASARVFDALTDRRTAVIATFLVALNPVVITRSIAAMSDMMAASLCVFALAIFLNEKARSTLWLCALAGSAAGLAHITRSIYIALILLPVLAFVLCQPRIRFSSVVVYLIGFLIVASPWMIFLYNETGSPLWSHSHLNVAFKMAAGSDGWNGFPTIEDYASWGDVIAPDPILFIKTWLRTLVTLPWTLLKTWPVIGALGFIGLFVWLREIRGNKLLLLAFLSLYAGLVSLVWPEERFLIVFMPFIALLVASAVDVVPDVSPKLIGFNGLERWVPLPTASLRTLCIVVLIGSLLLTSRDRVQEFFKGHAPEYQAAIDWLDGQVDSGDSILSAKPHFAFFTETTNINFRDVWLQQKDAKQFDAILAETNPTFVVFDEVYAAVHFPKLDYLLDAKPTRTLVPVKVIKTPRKLVIYAYRNPVQR